jgi:two-component system, OmpR family, sensor kinase
VVASRDFPGKGQGGLPVEGPEEVREVIAAFNEMSVRVNHSQEAQRAFVANVSHELKTPLTSIRGFAQAILDGTAGTEMDRLNAAQIIYDETGRMHRMVLALLDLARLDAGNFVLKVDQVEPVLLLGTVAEKLAIQARDAGVKVEVSAAKDLPLITGDGDRLAQVFTNLVENAIRYSPGNGTVRITLALTGNFLNVDIADEGPGIPEQDIPYIFDRFYQVDVSRQHGSGHGAGLGLAIAKEIVIAHRGTITAQSAPGNGSVFSVRLPVESPAPIKPGQSKNRRSIAQ